MRKIRSAAHDSEPHGDRPWVFFMVDCFFLITEFFVLTFQFKVEDSVLPYKMPPGSHPPSSDFVRPEGVIIDVHALGGGQYQIMGGESCSVEQLTQKMASLTTTSRKCSVKVSYEAKVPWGEVFTVFDVCARLKIDQCALVPLRLAQVPGSQP